MGAVEYTMLQAASLVPYSSTRVGPHARWSHNDKEPTLWINVRRQAWGWGTNTRMAIIGVVVGILGSLAVLARTILLLITRE